MSFSFCAQESRGVDMGRTLRGERWWWRWVRSGGRQMEPVAGGLEGEMASTSCLWLVPVSFMSVDPLPLSRFSDNSLFLPFCSMGVSYQCSVWHLCRTVVPAGKITPVTSGSWLCDLKRQPGFREVSPLSAQSRKIQGCDIRFKCWCHGEFAVWDFENKEFVVFVHWWP